MRILYFTHSLVSCWNHGNAHFQRGVLRALRKLGHDAIACEPEGGWSRSHLRQDASDAEDRFASSFADLPVVTYACPEDIAGLVGDSDLVIVHEWNDSDIITALGRWRRSAGFTLLFHDTHHRALSDPESLRTHDLGDYDGVLAFGEALAEIYRKWGWGSRAQVWHEAADTTHFYSIVSETPRHGCVWIGNWGDDERSEALVDFLLVPCRDSQTALDIYGVRYPEPALATLKRHGARYHGWLANADVPQVFSRPEFTVHVPRGFYARQLPGIPTIRVFEALACGVPLICAPWEDREGLFRAGDDFLVAHSREEMTKHMRALHHDPAFGQALAQSGLTRIRERHSCMHRALELVEHVEQFKQRAERV